MQYPTPATGGGKTFKKTFFSPALGVEKQYNIYLPPGYNTSTKRYPVVYLFRGHEDEWFNPYQDHSRGGVAVQHLADEMMLSGAVGEMIIVGPGMMSDDSQVYGLGVNFLNPRAAKKHDGVGTGQFEDYFINDVISHIDNEYRTISGGTARGADGFSLGGYTSVMLAVKHPGLFASVGSYDGSHMFYSLRDPRFQPGENADTLWMRRDSMFAPAFRAPKKKRYNEDYLRSYSPLDLLQNLPEKAKKHVKSTQFFIKTAAYDDYQGNRDRGVHLVTMFQLYGILNQASALVLSSDSHHTWKFADLHLRETLKKHAAVLGAKPAKVERKKGRHYLTHMEIVDIENVQVAPTKKRFRYRLYQDSAVKVNILSLTGEKVATLDDSNQLCGHHTREWKGQNNRGQWMPSGAYFIELETPKGALREKFVFLR